MALDRLLAVDSSLGVEVLHNSIRGQDIIIRFQIESYPLGSVV